MIVVDAGNTRLKFAWMELPKADGVPKTLGFVAIPVGQSLPVDTLGEWIRRGQPTRIVVDGSNVMHWKDETPRLATLNEVLSFLQVRGYNPGYREGKLWMELDHPFHIPPSPRPDSPL